MADKTYLQFRTEIANRLNRDDLSAEIITCIQEVIEEYQKELFYPSEAVETTIGTTVLNTRYYTLANISPRWQHVSQVDVFQGNWISLQKISNAEMDDIDVNEPPVPGLPSYWCIFGNQLRIFPCGGGYTLNLTLNKGPAAPVNDGDITFWTADAQSLIFAAACEKLCRDYIKDPERAGSFAMTVKKQELAMNSKTIAAMGTFQVKGYL